MHRSRIYSQKKNPTWQLKKAFYPQRETITQNSHQKEEWFQVYSLQCTEHGFAWEQTAVLMKKWETKVIVKKIFPQNSVQAISLKKMQEIWNYY